MAKTFNLNRQGGGTFSLVQDAQGNYSLKETGFDKIGPLNLPELGAVAATTTAAKTETAADKTESEIDKQTAEAFKLPEPQNDRSLDLDLLRQSKDLSESLSNVVSTPTTIQDSMPRSVRTPTTIQDSMPRPVRTPFTIQDSMPKDPTESVFGKSMPEEEQFTRQTSLPEVETPQQKINKKSIRVTADTFKGPGIYTEGIPGKNPIGGVDALSAQAQKEFDRKAMIEGATPDDPIANQLGTLGIKTDTTKLDTSRFAGSTAGTLADPAEKEDVKPASKRTFSESVKTALKGFKPPAVALIEAVVPNETQRLVNTANTTALKSSGYNLSFEGKVVGKDGKAVSAADSVFGGMNARSAFGDISRGGAKRVNTRKTVGQARVDAKYGKGSKESKAFADKTKAYEKELQEHNSKKNTEIEKNRKQKATNPNLQAGAGDGPGGCFIKGTLVTMANGSKKPIEKVDLGDYVAEGGKVFATGKFLINDLYNYKGIKVSGSHMVKENNVWTRVEDSRYGKLINTDEHVVYIFGSENRRILIDNILFTDYFEITDQEKLISEKDKFFDNWKIHEANEDINNINILNAN